MSVVWLEKLRLGRAVPVEVTLCGLQAFAHGQVCPFPGHRSHFFLTSPLFPLAHDALGQVPVLGPLQDPGSAPILPLHLFLPSGSQLGGPTSFATSLPENLKTTSLLPGRPAVPLLFT